MNRDTIIEAMARGIYQQRPHQYWDHSEQTQGWVYASYDEVDEGWRELARLQATAALAAIEAAGVRLVPVEATSPMVEQGAHHAFARWMPNESVQDNYDIARAQWRAMLAASPYAPQKDESK